MISGGVDLGRDNDARLLRLQTALALGAGFQLVLVEVEPGPIRKEVVRRIQTWSGHAAIGALSRVSLDPDVTLAAQLGVKAGAIVTGLEPPSPAEAPARDWIAELNWSRDALPGLVPGPLILIVSQAMHQALFERASDLYSWRRHTARITITARELARPLASPGDLYWLAERDRYVGFIATDIFSAKGRATMLVHLAEALLQLGDERGALHALDEISGLDSALPDDEFRVFIRASCKLLRAESALVRRDVAVARALLDAVDDAARISGLEGRLVLLRARCHTVDEAWDAAVINLGRALELARLESAADVLALAREGLCQVALARGDIVRARSEIGDLVEVARAHLDEWGIGMLLRIADVAGDVYPDEIGPLLDAAFRAVESALRTETLIAIQCLRVKRAWLLARADLALVELAGARRWSRPEDTAQTQAALSLAEAEVALMAGSTSEDEVVVPLTRAIELLRPSAPREAAVAGGLLGDFWRRRGRAELAVTAYRAAATDARAAGDHALARDAEFGELGAAVEGEVEQVDAPGRLRVLAEQLQVAEHAQREGISRADLGRCLLRRGLREAAVLELERARTCFAATTDAASERAVVQQLDAARP